jgi:TPR repeat protein
MVETRFTVNLLTPVPETVRTTVALQLAEKFNVSIAKMNRLMLTGQGPITKPISQRDATKIAKVLGRAGIEVAIVRSDLDEVLLLAEEPMVSREDRMELRELLLGASEASLPQASRLEESALAGKQMLGKQTPSKQVPSKQVPSKQTQTDQVSGNSGKPLLPSKLTPFFTRPRMIAIVSLLAAVVAVAFGVKLMLPDRPLLPGGETLSPFEQGIAASAQGDYAKAFELWQKSADPTSDSKGDKDAQFELAWLYTNGLGTPKDLEKAALYFGKAAEQGHVEAQNKLGQLYLYGQGVTQNRAEAITWLTAAADKGLGEAQLTLGKIYLKGEGLAVNLSEADKWLNLAAQQGVKGANEALAEFMQLQAVAKIAGSNPDVFAAVEKNDPQAVIGAVLAGADVNARSADGYTPLMYAVTKGNPEVVREVLSGGADINAQSATGWTALMFAAKNSPDSVSLLLEKGADKSLKNSVGQSAYDIAKVFQLGSADLLVP